MVEVLSGRNGIRVRVKGALLFDPGAAHLRAQAQPILDMLIKVLGQFGYYLLVEGHTDSTPISTSRFPSNWELSGDRASAVLRYLISKGVDPMRLTSVGLADNYPLSSNDTPEGRAKNRRVEFVLTKRAFRPEIS
jgi:chemotaxis protein MotB